MSALQNSPVCPHCGKIPAVRAVFTEMRKDGERDLHLCEGCNNPIYVTVHVRYSYTCEGTTWAELRLESLKKDLTYHGLYERKLRANTEQCRSLWGCDDSLIKDLLLHHNKRSYELENEVEALEKEMADEQNQRIDI